MTKAHLVTVVASHDGTDPQRYGTHDAGSAVVIDGDRTVTPPEVRLCAADLTQPEQLSLPLSERFSLLPAPCEQIHSTNAPDNGREAQPRWAGCRL